MPLCWELDFMSQCHHSKPYEKNSWGFNAGKAPWNKMFEQSWVLKEELWHSVFSHCSDSFKNNRTTCPFRKWVTDGGTEIKKTKPEREILIFKLTSNCRGKQRVGLEPSVSIWSRTDTLFICVTLQKLLLKRNTAQEHKTGTQRKQTGNTVLQLKHYRSLQ